MIAHLLPHEPGEWVRLIGPINVVADNRLYAIVDVDSLARTLTGVPQAWRALLTDDLVTHVLRAEARLASAVGTDDEKELKSWPPGARGRQMPVPRHPGAQQRSLRGRPCYSPGARGSLVDGTLRRPIQCRHRLLGTGRCGSGERYARLPVRARARLADRRALVCDPWRFSAGACARAGSAEELEYDSSHGQCVGRLVVNTVALGGSFNVLISDPKDGIEVIFGSFAWLRSGLSSTEKHLSIRLCRSSVGARFCDFAADLATKDERIRTSSAMTSLRKLAARLRSAPSVAPPPAGSDLVTAESNVFFDEAVGW